MLAVTTSPHIDHSLMRLIVDNLANCAVALYDETLHILCVGGELLPSLGLGDTLEGRHLSEIFPAMQTELLTQWFTSALNGKPMSQTWPNGDRVFNITIRRVESGANTAIGMVLVQDLKALTADQESKLREASQRATVRREVEMVELKARMIERILHEFRNPLAAAASSADILETYGSGLSPEKRQHHVTHINQELHRLSGILDDILTLLA